MEIRGVIIFGVRDEQVAWSRMYLEPVEPEDRSLSHLIDDLAGSQDGE